MLSMTRFMLWSIRLGELVSLFIYFVNCVLLISCCCGMRNVRAGNYEIEWHTYDMHGKDIIIYVRRSIIVESSFPLCYLD